ncbi:MAG: O-antigen ligase family protein [Bacteroidales bacterium]
MSAHSKTAAIAITTVHATVALSLPAAIVFGRSALGVALALAVIAMAAGAAAGLRWPLWPRPARMPAALLAVVCVALLPAVTVSLNPAMSAVTLLHIVALVAGGTLTASLLARHGDLRASRIFIAGMLAALLFAVAALYLHPGLVAFRSRGPAVPSMMLKASASAIACALPLLIYLGWRLGGRWRVLAALCLPLGVAVMYGTSSKSSLAGMLAALAVGGLVALTRRWRPAAAVAVAVVLAGLAAAGLNAVLKTTPAQTYGGYALFAPPWLVDVHRQTIWQFALDRFRERPWLGWGVNVINTVPGAGDNIPEINGEFIPSHPHNWMVETLSESGVAGFVPVLAVVLGVAAAAVGAYRRSGEPAWLAWLALWLTYWSAGAFNFSMWNSAWQASGMVLAALMCSHLIGRNRV